MTEPWVRALFSTRGRLSRGTFWWAMLVWVPAFGAVWVVLDRGLGFGAALLTYPLFGWVAFAICARRMHDRGHASGWLLLALLPAIGPLILFVEMGLRRGTPGENGHGPDPLELRPDYLTVR